MYLKILSFKKINESVEDIIKQLIHNRDKLYMKEMFSPEKTTLKDDAFHGLTITPSTEWWYFDAIFSNGYSVHIGFEVFSVFKKMFKMLRLDIYKDEKLISHTRRFIFLKNTKISKDKPFINISSNGVMSGSISKEGKLVYKVNVDLGGASADLRFTGVNNGFKGSVPGSNWVVMLPRADVKGLISIENEDISVEGIGYHDHNWGITPSTILNNYGWIWSKIYSENYTIIWADVFKTKEKNFPILVFSDKQKEDFINFEPFCFKIELKDVKKQNGVKIPHGFTLSAEKNNIFINVDVKVRGIHYASVLRTIKYWRYHVKNKGVIRVGNVEEKINNIDLAEYLILK